MDALKSDLMLAGRYRLREELGVGTMSVVWQAYDRVLERQVAVKVLTGQFRAMSYRRRTRAATLAAAKLVHPHLVRVFDYLEDTAPDGTILPLVIQELVDGDPLEYQLRSGPLPWQFAVRVTVDVADALAAAHEHGLVHGGLTAGAVLLSDIGPKVIDLGVSESAAEPDVSPATDVHALGRLLHRMLTGGDPVDVAGRTYRSGGTSPLPVAAGLPAGVEQLLEDCRAVRAADRPTAEELADELSYLLERVRGSVDRPGGPAHPGPSTTTYGSAAAQRGPTTYGTPVGAAPPDDHYPADREAGPDDRYPADRGAADEDTDRTRPRRRGLLIGVAAAAVLLVGGAVTISAVTGGDAQPLPGSGRAASVGYPEAPADSSVLPSPGSSGHPATPSRSTSPSASSSRSASASPTPSRSHSASPTPAEPPQQTPANQPPSCSVGWSVSSDWGNGFTAQITVHSSTTPSSWTLSFQFPGNQRVTSGRRANFGQSGHSVTASWGGSGQSTATIGLTASYWGSNPAPTGFALNGIGCG